MKKEEVLEKARKENKNKDYVLIEAENKGSKIAGLAALILSSVYFTSDIFIRGNTNYGWYSLIAIYIAILYGYRGIKSHKKLDIFLSIVWGISTVIMVYAYMKSLITSSTIL